MIWLDRDLQWSGVVSGKRGRTSTFSDAAIQFFLTIKCLFGLAQRQAMGMEAATVRKHVSTARVLCGVKGATP